MQRFPKAWRNFTSKLCKGKCLWLLGRASSTLICRSRRDCRSTSGPRRNSCARGSTSPRVVSTSQPSLKVQIGSTSSEWLGTGLVALSASLTKSSRASSLQIKEAVAEHTISKLRQRGSTTTLWGRSAISSKNRTKKSVTKSPKKSKIVWKRHLTRLRCHTVWEIRRSRKSMRDCEAAIRSKRPFSGKRWSVTR